MIKIGDFVKLNYTGKLQNGTIFDTTLPALAKHAALNASKTLTPVTICVGQHMLIPGLDEALIGKGMGNFVVTLPAEKAFGKKDPNLLKIVPVTELHKQKIEPAPGMQLNIDDQYGIVRSVSSGRAVVDFNHPLANQEVTYGVEVLAIVSDAKEQVQALLDPVHIPYTEVRIEGSNALIRLPQLLPQPVLDLITTKIVTLTAIKTVSFEQGQEPAKMK